MGTWWDVTSKGAALGDGDSSLIGGDIQEVDVWAGLAYSIGDFTVKGTYQQWIYLDETEDILDFTLSYNTFLTPSITIHNRLDKGGAFGDEGTVVVGSLSYSFEAGPVTIAFPLNIAYFATEDFHNPDFVGGSDTGFGYGSLGATVTYPLAFISEAYGKWSIHGGVTYYVTDDEIIPNNVQDDFLTANLGLTIAF